MMGSSSLQLGAQTKTDLLPPLKLANRSMLRGNSDHRLNACPAKSFIRGRGPGPTIEGGMICNAYRRLSVLSHGKIQRQVRG